MPRDGRGPDAHCPHILPHASHSVSLFGKYDSKVRAMYGIDCTLLFEYNFVSL